MPCTLPGRQSYWLLQQTGVKSEPWASHPDPPRPRTQAPMRAGSLVALAAWQRGGGGYDTRTSREVTHPSTIPAHGRLTAEFGWDLV